MTRSRRQLTLASLVFVIAGPVLAESASAQLALAQSSIGGGGGVSSGGDYALAASVGDESSGELTGGDFSVTGGEINPPPPESCVADLAPPTGVLDFSDIIAFLSAFSAMQPEADLAEPVDVYDFSDVVAFLTAFAAGCP